MLTLSPVVKVLFWEKKKAGARMNKTAMIRAIK
jgi:hypothetical protein